MKVIIFDSSTIINFALNNLLWILAPLKEQYKGEFYITESIKKEIIERPLQIKRFKLEAIQIRALVEKGTLKVYKEETLQKEMQELESLVNQIFLTKKRPLKIIDEGELSALVLAKKIHAEALAIDERTTRFLIESPLLLNTIFRSKFKTNITIEEKKLKAFKQAIGELPIIRSVELGILAYERGILDAYLPQKNYQTKKELIDALLWSMRIKGCAISEREMQEILKEELRQDSSPRRNKKKK